MNYRFRPMDENSARTIAGWHYEGIYAFYDMDRDNEDLQELLDPRSWPERYYAVTDELGDLVGFFCFEREPEAVVLGLGLRPDLTGQGLGQAFLEAGLEFARERFGPATFRLSVATFNQRAIRVYRRVGFQDAGVFVQETNGGQHEFLRMTKKERLRSRVEAIKRDIAATVRAVAQENVHVAHYGAFHIHPRYLVYWVCVKTDAEKHRLQADQALLQQLRAILVRYDYPPEGRESVHIGFESQETVDRESGG